MIKSAKLVAANKGEDFAWIAGTMGMAITAIMIAAFCHALEASVVPLTAAAKGRPLFY